MILAAVYIVLLCFLIYRSKWFGGFEVPRLHLIGLFLLKFAVGIGLTALYTYYYESRENADVYKYFDDGMILYNALSENPGDYLRMIFGIDDSTYIHETYYSEMQMWYRPYETTMYNDSRVMIRANAIMALTSFGSFIVHHVWFAFISFIGSLLMFKAFRSVSKTLPWMLMSAVFLMPTVLFWSSAPLKEAFLMLCLGAIMFGVLRKESRIWIRMVLALSGVALLYALKFYVLFALSVPVAAYIIGTGMNRPLIAHGIVYATATLTLIVLELTHVTNLLELLALKQADFVRMADYYGAGSQFDVPATGATLMEFLPQIPMAFITGLLRPFPWEAHNILALVAVAETCGIWLSFTATLFVRKRAKDINWNMMFMIIGFIVILSIIIGSATPVFGALVRYRLPLLPFIGLLILLVLDHQKIQGILNWNETK